MSSSDHRVSHDIALLSDSLRQLQAQQETAKPVDDDVTQNPDDMIPRTIHSRDDYGFRKSGILTPSSGPNNPTQLSPNQPMDNVVPDPNGLGWPGKWSYENYSGEF
jgi:GTP cyclohydrolase I